MPRSPNAPPVINALRPFESPVSEVKDCPWPVAKLPSINPSTLSPLTPLATDKPKEDAKKLESSISVIATLDKEP